MLIEGSGPPAGDGSDDKPQRERKPAPGTSRLQQYTAQPSEVAAEPTTTLAPAQAAAAPGARAGAPVSEEAIAAASATRYGVPVATPTEEAAPEREAITVQEQEQEAKTYRARRSKEMSWDDYLGLSDRGRAAVDFNTMLIQARQKDLRSQDDYQPTDDQRAVYDKAVERMFGETGVSETFAPETVALLNDIDFQQSDAKRFDDLDDFLGLASALSAKDIEKIGRLKVDPTVGEGGNQMDLSLGGLVQPEAPSETASQVATGLARGTSELQESLTRGNQILENWKLVSAGTRNESLAFFGGTPNRLASPDIRLNKADDEYFQLAFDTLADASNGPEVLGLIEQDLGPQRMKQFMRYADTKSQYSVDQQVGLGGNPAIQYRSPDEFREILGLNKGGETDGTR